jgi:TetR/AcrR family transcriptional repressor of nem operon
MPEPGSTPKGEATRRRLVEVAAGVFAQRGYAATTMNDLIAASGLTKGAFYFHFPSKEQLALAVLLAKQAAWVERVEREVASLAPGRARLAALAGVLVGLHAADPGSASISRLSRELVRAPGLETTVRRTQRRWVDLVADLVREGQAREEFRSDVDAEAVAVVLVAAFDGLKDLGEVIDPAGDAGDTVVADEVLAARARTLTTVVLDGLST